MQFLRSCSSYSHSSVTCKCVFLFVCPARGSDRGGCWGGGAGGDRRVARGKASTRQEGNRQLWQPSSRCRKPPQCVGWRRQKLTRCLGWRRQKLPRCLWLWRQKIPCGPGWRSQKLPWAVKAIANQLRRLILLLLLAVRVVLHRLRTSRPLHRVKFVKWWRRSLLAWVYSPIRPGIASTVKT